jgi:poly-gamma-glutamate capsule biosynthesis protein CapA/YwtB (metallophosphatase superfamily)
MVYLGFISERILMITAVLFLSLSYVDKEMNNNSMKDKKYCFSSGITLFLCGDVMTGRGVDQILPNSVDPALYEPYVKDARVYVRLAEKENGKVDQPVSYSYIWGDALEIWEQMEPDFKIINLETSITTHDVPWPGKSVNYRMHPKNIQVLTTAGIDFCSLANNHILDWGCEGLAETLQKLKNADITCAGAAINQNEACKPAVLEMERHRVIIFAFGSETSGIPASWAATAKRYGVNLLPGMNDETVNIISRQVNSIKKTGDIVIFSIHWGSNWGYNIPASQRNFAHRLIDDAYVDIIHGHSSHHPRGIEVYKNKLIVYGAGDFINDYEGIRGYDEYRDDLAIMYFPFIDPLKGTLISMKMVPMQIRNLCLNRVSVSDAVWLHRMMNRESTRLGSSVTLEEDLSLLLHWK